MLCVSATSTAGILRDVTPQGGWETVPGIFLDYLLELHENLQLSQNKKLS